MARHKNIIPYDSDDKDYEDNLEATRDILGYFPPECPDCGTTMKFNFTTRMFKCFNCGYTADEEDGENMAYSDDYSEIFGKHYGSNRSNICKDCNGPWPKCKSSCKILDDED